MNEQFELQYLPLFWADLDEACAYIAFTLQNPIAARRLMEDTEKAILKRLQSPLGYEPYPSAKDRKHVYYRIRVRNYMVFYVVMGEVMEVRRFVYDRRDMRGLM